MEQVLFDALMTYGAMGACLVYFIYKDLSTNKELKETINKNTQALAEFTSILHIFSEKITRGE